MVLADAQITDRETGSAQGTEQLMAVVLKRLQPGAWSGADAEQAAAQIEGAAVGSQLGPGQARPRLPEGGHRILSLPGLLQILEAGGE